VEEEVNVNGLPLSAYFKWAALRLLAHWLVIVFFGAAITLAMLTSHLISQDSFLALITGAYAFWFAATGVLRMFD
jgi:hypothetical protein